MKYKLEFHPSITPERVMEALEDHELSLDNPGFCISCGDDAEGYEPDAEYCECENCGLPSVFGAMQLALILPGITR